MTHWLKNVNQFLEKLDDRAAEAIPDEEDDNDDEDESLLRPVAVPDVRSILAARGLPIQNIHNDDDSKDNNEYVDEIAASNPSDLQMDEEDPEIVPHSITDTFTTEPVNKADSETGVNLAEDFSSSHGTEQTEKLSIPFEDKTTIDKVPILYPPTETQESIPQHENLLTASSTSPNSDFQLQMQQYEERLEDMRAKLHDQQRITGEANREARTLRRSVVALNQQLEAADREIEAQRNELDNAGRRIEHERRVAKDAMEAIRNEHAQQIQHVQKQHQQQINELKTALRLAERQHDQNGGDWNNQKAEYERTCQQLQQTIESMQEEKDTLTSRIQTLVDQQESLGWRLESLTRAAEAAELARDCAEQKVDETLAMHAQQIRARQARETELEHTVAQLSAALASTEKTTATAASTTTLAHTSIQDGRDEEIESLRQNLEHERSQNELLRSELAALSKERDAESAALHQLQITYDRQTNELNQQILNLQRQQEGNEGGFSNSEINKNSKHSSKLDDDYEEERTRLLAMQRTLSEEVSKLRQQLSDSHAEVSALRSRLNVALHRATVAEAEAAESYEASSSMRRRRHNQHPQSKLAGAMPSMKAALFFSNTSSTSRPTTMNAFANMLDGVDEVAAKTGMLLRNNAVARLLFGKSFCWS